VQPERLYQIKYCSDTIKNRTRDLPTYSAVSHPTAPKRAPHNEVSSEFYFSWYRKNVIYNSPKNQIILKLLKKSSISGEKL
jgi:hypothetical protein